MEIATAPLFFDPLRMLWAAATIGLRSKAQTHDAVAKEALLEIANTYERIGAIAQSRRIGNS